MNEILERYSRQVMLPDFGEDGQRRLLEASVLIVGAGGLGAPVATYLTGAGVGHIGIADPDVVSLSNLQRQTLYAESQIGQPKTVCAHERLQAISSVTRFTLYPEGLTDENARQVVKEYDLVMDCTDNFVTRYLIDDACEAAGVPWVHGAIGEFCGQVAVLNHRKKRHYRDLYADREALCERPIKVSGVIGAVPGVIGALQAAEAVKILVGIGESLDGRLFTIDVLTLNTAIIDF